MLSSNENRSATRPATQADGVMTRRETATLRGRALAR